MSERRRKLLPCKPEGIPEEIKDLGDFLIWDQLAKSGKRFGKPVSIEGFGDSVSRWQDWQSFREVVPIVKRDPRYYPLLVLTDNLGITCFDVDKKPRKEGETVEQCEARHERAEKAFRELLTMFPGAYVERSKSGQGYHVFVRGSFERENIGSGGASGKWSEVEVYCRSRGIILTGHPVKGIPFVFESRDYSTEIRILVDEMRPPKSSHHEETFAEGKISEEFARSVLAQIVSKIGRPGRADWVKIASATADGVGKELAVELMDDFFPVLSSDNETNEQLINSLGKFAPWETLRAFGVNPDPPETYFSEVTSTSLKEGGMGGGYDFERFDRETSFDPLNPPPEPVPVISIKGKGLCTRGNLSILQGPTKGGKSACVSAIGGAAMSVISDSHSNDLLGFTVDLGEGESVLHFDTEQSRVHHHALGMRMMKRAGITELPDKRFRSRLLVELDIEDRKRFFADCLEKMREEGAPPALILLDGVADFCRDVNDIEEANALVRWLHQLSMEYDCVILGVIHENPGTQNSKTRGHLGSELARKVETSLKVTKDPKTEQSTLWVHESRGAPLSKGEGVCFEWSNREGMHVSLGNAQDIKDGEDRANFEPIVEEVFSENSGSFRHGELVKRIEMVENVKEGTAKNRVRRWLELGLILKEGAAYHMAVGLDDDF